MNSQAVQQPQQQNGGTNTKPVAGSIFSLFMRYYIIIAVIILIAWICYKVLIRMEIIKEDLFTDSFIAEISPESKLLTDKPGNYPNVSYVYWTGGYDSTYRVCEMLLIEGKIVQPLYVTLPLDNDCQVEETCNKLWVRRNRKLEMDAMATIRAELEVQYPAVKTRLLPTIYIDKDIDDAEFNKAFEAEFYEANLWPGKRHKHQYLFLSKFAAYNKVAIDIGVLGIHEDSKFAKFLRKYLVLDPGSKSRNYMVNIPDSFISYLRFPLFGRTKKDLLLTARKYGFDKILKKTWSCWFPNIKTGKPCGKCPMCRERIIPHPESIK